MTASRIAEPRSTVRVWSVSRPREAGRNAKKFGEVVVIKASVFGFVAGVASFDGDGG